MYRLDNVANINILLYELGRCGVEGGEDRNHFRLQQIL